MQGFVAVVDSILAFYAWRMEKDLAWLEGGVLLFAVIPSTLIVISQPTRNSKMTCLFCGPLDMFRKHLCFVDRQLGMSRTFQNECGLTGVFRVVFGK